MKAKDVEVKILESLYLMEIHRQYFGRSFYYQRRFLIIDNR